MRRLAGVVLGVVASLVVLTGCGKQIVLREDAAALSSEMAKVTLESQKFYQDLAKARSNFLLRTLAEGEHCQFEPRIVMVVENNRARCMTDAERDGVQPLPSGAHRIQADLLAEPMQPALRYVAVLGEFQAIVAKIVEDPEFDATTELTAILDKACSLNERLQALGARGTDKCTATPASADGGGAAAGTPVFADEVKALAALIDLVRASREARQDMNKLQTAYTQHGGVVSDAIKGVLRHYSQLDLQFAGLLSQRVEVAKNRALNEQLAALPRLANGSLDVSKRYALLATRYADLESYVHQTRVPDPLTASLEGLLKAHETFQGALLEGNLTAAQRKRIAESNFTQLKQWIGVVRTIVGVF